MSNIHTDLSTVQVSVAPNTATAGTSLGVTDAQAALLPDIYPWWGLVRPVNSKPTRANSEIVKVTGGSSTGGTTTYTIVRTQGIPVTTARSIIVGDDISEVHTAQKQIDTEKKDGWENPYQSWTYNAADKITVPSGAASIYKKGDPIKFTQHGVVKYGNIKVVADTLLTIFVNTDFVVEDTATYPITLNYYSHQANPVGILEYFGYTPTLGKLSGYTSCVYNVCGNKITWEFKAAIKTISAGAGQVTITPPVMPSISGLAVGISAYNGSAYTICYSEFGPTTLTIWKDVAASNWAGGESSVTLAFSFTYIF